MSCRTMLKRSTKQSLTNEDLVELQDSLNSVVNTDWKTDYTSNMYKLAAFAEIGELIESYPYKWWKFNQTLDEHNAKIEAIDILHFYMSSKIINGSPIMFVDSLFDEFTIIETHTMYDQLCDRCASFVSDFDDRSMVGLLKSVELSSMYELSAYYVAKVLLNEFRQVHGYNSKSGYAKTIDGVEDNVLLADYVDEFFDSDGLTIGEFSDIIWGNLSERYEL